MFPTRPFPAPLARQIEAALPAVLVHLEHAANPERALTNLERLCDASGNRLSLLRALGEAPEFARAVLAILGGASLVANTLIMQPELLDLAAQRPLIAEPKSWQQAWGDCRSYCLTFRDRKAAVRRWKKREMLRIALRDLALWLKSISTRSSHPTTMFLYLNSPRSHSNSKFEKFKIYCGLGSTSSSILRAEVRFFNGQRSATATIEEFVRELLIF